MQHRLRRHGFTLTEVMVTLSIIAILLAIAVPSFAWMFASLRVQGASAEFGTDLHYARTEALRQRTAVSVTSNAEGSGYAILAGATILKNVALPPGVTVTAQRSVQYDAMRALAAPEAQSFVFATSGGGSQLTVVTNVMGRVQYCSPSGSMGGYPTC